MLCFINANKNKNDETTELTHNIYVVCHAFGPLSHLLLDWQKISASFDSKVKPGREDSESFLPTQ